MIEIKISKVFEDKSKFNDFKSFIMSIPRKNRENLKEAWVLKFEKNEDFMGVVAQIGSKLGEYKMTDHVFSYCCSQQMEYDESSKFTDAFYLYFSEFVAYVLNTSIINLIFYLEDNNYLNVESFLRFNMKGLEKEITMKLENPDDLAGIFGLSESDVLDKFDFIDMFASAEQILNELNCKLEEFKDFKIYKDKEELICVADNRVKIDRDYFGNKYGVVIEPDTDDLEALTLLIALFVPKRIIFFSSLSDDEKAYIAGMVNSLKDIIGEVQIMASDDARPR